MVERVNTGGVMSFDYSKAREKRLNTEQKEEIERGYDEYYDRKDREKKKKFFIIVMIVILVLAGILAWLMYR